MNIKEFIDGIFYVGVNDRTTTRFEALWPLPFGVSYNSYIVKGNQKTALIDTVHVAEANEYLAKIKNIAGNTGLDYLVINHMEPDHSGSIGIITTAFPDIKIVGNKQTIDMVKSFYGINAQERFIEIKEGDRIELGGKTLTFALAPMVHWPETMVTYVAENKVLFSGDAFGTFGALCGGVVDYEMDTHDYFPEMYRYYSNIVGKYGIHVQRALQKVRSLEIDFICPTHGPVWHDELDRVIDITDRLSKYESEDGVTIIYGSMYGNTAVVADEIAAGLNAAGIKKIKMHDASFSDLSYMISDAFRYKGLIIGCPTYSMHIFPPVEQLMIALETREIKNKVFATFGSYTWASVVPKKLGDYSEILKLPVVATVEMKRAINDDTRSQIDALVKAVAEGLKS